MKKRLINRLSFSLLEIIVVTTIIGLIGTAGFGSYTTTNRNSRDTKRKADLESIKPQLSVYYQIKGAYPSSLSWNGNLTEDNNTYIENIPQDPMNDSGYTYYYNRTSDGSFALCTLLENSNVGNDVAGTQCKSDGTKCNYCTNMGGNYTASVSTASPNDPEIPANCVPQCSGKCGGEANGCVGGGVCPNPCQTNQTCASGICTNIVVSEGFPVGGIMFIATSEVPDGFLECNGQSTTGHDALKAVVGNNVPDLRDQFIRGWNPANRTIGSTQMDAIKAHTHTLKGSDDNKWGQGFYRVHPAGTDGYFAGATGTTGDTETRPKNVALMAIIKY